MLIFAITTSTKVASLSIYEKNKFLGNITIEVSKSHSTTILSQIEELFIWCNKKIDDITHVVVSKGPGSFTGVRIAMSIIKGLFVEKNALIYEVNELDALSSQAANFLEKGQIALSMIDSRKEKIYFSMYEKKDDDNIEMIENYSVSTLDNIIELVNTKYKDYKILAMGDAYINYKEKIILNIGSNLKYIDENYVRINSETFINMYLKGKANEVDLVSLKPEYLEKSQAEKDLHKKNKKGD